MGRTGHQKTRFGAREADEIEGFVSRLSGERGHVGNLDLTTSNQDDNSVSVLLGDGRGDFKPASGSPFAVGRAPYPHAIGDVNRDGKLDIVTPNVGSNNVTVLLGDGKGGFTPAANSPYPVGSRPYYIAVGDTSGDGNPDLMTTHDDISLMTTLLGDGRGGFRAGLAARPRAARLQDYCRRRKQGRADGAGHRHRVQRFCGRVVR